MQMETRSLFELGLDSPLLDGLSLVNVSMRNDHPEDTRTHNKEHEVQEQRVVPVILEVSDRMFCTTCQCGFDGREEQTEHYKLDWHRFNLKRRIMGGSSVTAEEFEDRTCAGDLSSISGSDSDSSSEDEESDTSTKSEVEANATKMDLQRPTQRPGGQSHKILFRNTQGQLLAVYQCVLGPRKESEELAESLKSLQEKPCWVILMAGGGHFAGAVFRGNEVLEHKTFHRYTVRAKRGTAQGLKDGQSRSNMPKSAGASLRRYNEAALLKDVQDLLESWAEHLKEARTIYLRAPSHNKTLFFGRKNAPFQKNDPRVCSVPFITRRATFKEVQRVHTTLSTLQVYAKDTLVGDITSPLKKDWRKVKKAPTEEHHGADTEPSPVPSEEDGDSLEGPLEMVEVTLDTLSLREFEVMPKRNQKKKKKKVVKKSNRDFSAKDSETFLQPPNSAPKTAEGQEAAPGGKKQPKARRDLGDVLYQLRNDLFTACKTGDTGSLRRLLKELVGSGPGSSTHQDADVPTVSEPSVSVSDPASPLKVPTLATEGTRMDATQTPSKKEPPTSKHRGAVPQSCPANETLRTDVMVSTGTPSVSPLVNERIDAGGFTLLHVAASAGQSSIVSLLMDAGWDPAVRDDLGQTPFSVCADKHTRNVFRKYRAEHPDKYNYIKAQIPAPLTAELEAKREEKKRAQKAQKKQREKEEKEEKKRKEEEEAEKRRFTALSDREKRALAAEKRLAAQLCTSGAAITNTRRCWQCGEALLGRIPFEYLDFSFCSTRCLQEHRKTSRSTKP